MTKHAAKAIPFFIFIYLNSCYSQNSGYLYKKYSYHTTSMIDNKPILAGTGFFLKYKSKFYLVSAWHSFSFKNHISKTFENPDAANINNIVIYKTIKDIRPGKYLRLEVNSRKKLPSYLEKRLNDTLFDISAIEVLRTPSFEFDYIDFKIVDTNQITIDDSVFYYGFPIINGKQQDTTHFFSGNVTQIDNHRNEYIINIGGYIGCSGSPVFRVSDNKIALKGLLFYALKDSSGRADTCKAVDI